MVVVGIGLVVRVIAAWQLTSHIDEPASVLAIRMTAERGAPIFPSDILYLQGATLSYLLAPFGWFGVADLDHLHLLRLVSVVAGTAAVYLTYRIGYLVVGAVWPGLFAAGLVALDPLSVQWSGHVRMYAPLQALTLLVVFLVLAEIQRGDSTSTTRRLVWLTIAFWLSVFTHVEAALLWPALVLIAVMLCGRALFTERRDLIVVLALCALAPIALSGINGVWTVVGGSPASGGERPGFVGDYLLDLDRALNPQLTAWTTLFAPGDAAGLIPTTIVALSGLVAGRWLLSPSRPGPLSTHALGAVLACYWLPVLLVAALTSEPQSRYLVQIHPLGFVLTATGIATLTRANGEPRKPHRRIAADLVAACVAVLFLVHTATGLWDRFEAPVVDPDYPAALRYVVDRRAAEEPVAVAMPPAAYLAFGGGEGLSFLAGAEDHIRVRRYTRIENDGQRTDYWAGIPAIAANRDLCAFLRDNRIAWIVVDRQRLGAGWAYAGSFADILTGGSRVAFTAPGNAEVRRPLPVPLWTTRATSLCRESGVRRTTDTSV